MRVRDTRSLALAVVVLIGSLATALASKQAIGSSEPAATGNQASLTDRINRAIAKVAERRLSSDQHTPWAIMHAAIAFQSAAKVYDVETREEIQAIEFLLTRAQHEDRRIFRVIDDMLVLPRVPVVEYHVNQHLMMLALADVRPERELIADAGKRYRVSDLINAAKLGFEEQQEVGWTLVALSTYLSFADQWTAANGRVYKIEDVLGRGIERDPRNETEGGAHHLFGVAYALRAYVREHEVLQGVWREAKEYIRRHVQTTRRFQQDDGAFSAGLLSEAAAPTSPSELVFSTGHTLEWLSVALTGAELEQPWVERAVRRLCAEIELHPIDAFSDGGIYHAVSALRLYRDARYGADVR